MARPTTDVNPYADHQRQAPVLIDGDGWVGSCRCGWRSNRVRKGDRGRAIANRSAGLHVSAAWKRHARAVAAEINADPAGWLARNT